MNVITLPNNTVKSRIGQTALNEEEYTTATSMLSNFVESTDTVNLRNILRFVSLESDGNTNEDLLFYRSVKAGEKIMMQF
jgi:hypothetical protein